MCHLLEVSYQGYYRWVKNGSAMNEDRDKELKDKIYQLFVESHQTYGIGSTCACSWIYFQEKLLVGQRTPD